MFTGALLEVAHEILVVGGALCVIALFFVLLWSLICVMKFSRLITNVRQSYKNVVSATKIPASIIQKIMTDSSSE